MQVIYYLLISIIIIFALVYWYITLPILAILLYIINLIISTPQQLRNPSRHILWWSFLIIFCGGIYYRDSISDFCDDVLSEYNDHKDPILNHAILFEETMEPLTTTEVPNPNELYGGLKVGISPLHTVIKLTIHDELKQIVNLDSIHLHNLNRHYLGHSLYGISFDIRLSTKSLLSNIFDEGINFLSNKYGLPHDSISRFNQNIVKWKFPQKHILIVSNPKSRNISGQLFIYNPEMLQQKIDKHLQTEALEKAELEKERKAAEEEQQRKLKAIEEAERERENENRRLRESL